MLIEADLGSGASVGGQGNSQRSTGAFGCRRPIGRLVFALLSAVVLLQQPAAGAADVSSAAQIAAAPFDIPSQPLEDALYAFDAATGIEVFVDGPTVAGRRSMAIKGVFTPVQALRAMLAGTGLDARLIGPDAITLSLGAPQQFADGTRYRDYSALVQAAVVRVLCARPETRPGGYRVALQLLLGPSGIISTANLLSSTGDAIRDRRLEEVLAGISVGRPPPPNLPQRIIMVILPRPPHDSGDCSR